jgi:CspA family cold shock protein
MSGQISAGEVGEVVHYNDERGYGFISTDHPAVDDDVFVHISDIDYERLYEGESVYYQLHENRQGHQAFGVIAVERDGSRNASGEIEFYNPDKGYGFIGSTSNVAQEVFVHLSDVAAGELHEGDSVKFNMVSGDDGPAAKHVRVKGASPPAKRDDPDVASKAEKDTAEMSGQKPSPDATASGPNSETGANPTGSGDPTNKNKLLNGDQ